MRDEEEYIQIFDKSMNIVNRLNTLDNQIINDIKRKKIIVTYS